MTEYKFIGRPTPLLEGRGKVTGAVRFAPDLQMAGLLHARPVGSLYAHAQVRGIDVSAALAVPGVAAVLTAKDLPDIAPSSRSRLLLARDRVIFAGQPVALVLATNAAAAHDGAQAVAVDYEPLPAVSTLDAALAEDAPLVWPDGVPSGENISAGAHGADVAGVEDAPTGKPSNLSGEETYTRGDAAAGLAEADVIVERTYTTPSVHQTSLETHSIVCQPNPFDQGMTIWSSTQAPFDVRHDVAEMLGVPEPQVRVVLMPVGGGFGGKFGLYEPLVALAAQRLRAPVRFVLTRLEEMQATNPAPAARIHLRLGAKRDGTLTALAAELQVDDGCFPADFAGFFSYMLASFYRVPNLAVHGVDVVTFKPSVGAYRAPGATTVIFALDSAMDELARALDLDPIEFRLRHLVRPGDPRADGKPWPGMGMAEVLERLQAHPAWQNRAAAQAQGRGIGVAVGGWLGGVEPAAAACSLERDGGLVVNIGSVDLNGTSTGFALMAAEVFGISPKKVRVVASDTDSAPFSGATGGSKVTITTGAAVVQAAAEARRQALAVAAEMLEAAVEDLEIVDSSIRVRGSPATALSLASLAQKTMEFGGRFAPVFAAGRIAQTGRAPAFSAQLAEVEVDPGTGEVTLHRMVLVQDVGRAINPLAIEGQMLGGATQGIGWALYEAVTYDEQGQLLTGTFQDYALADSRQTPAMETIIIEVPSENGPFGARGVGEAPVIPTAAAIANAIADATGARLTDLPMTAPRVLAGLDRTLRRKAC